MVHDISVAAALSSVNISWKEPEPLNGILVHYTIQYTINRTLQLLQTTNNTNFSIPNLTPNTLVSDITVSATTGGGEGPAVTAPNITTLSRPGKAVNTRQIFFLNMYIHGMLNVT